MRPSYGKSRISSRLPRKSVDSPLDYYRFLLRSLYSQKQSTYRHALIVIEKLLAGRLTIEYVSNIATFRKPRNRGKPSKLLVISYASLRLNFRRYPTSCKVRANRLNYRIIYRFNSAPTLSQRWSLYSNGFAWLDFV